jgi:ribulose-phosphate 3-epimerase
MKPVRIAPSILAADFANLGSDVARVAAHVDMLHIDVMDGHFVPNITLGIPVIRSLRAATDLPFDCHLMTTNPDAYLEELAAAGATSVTVHMEVFPDPTRVAAEARAAGLGFGVVINPPTPAAAVEPFLELCDMVVVMSVHPGFGGQSFIEEVLPKVEKLREVIDSRALPVDIEIDGGITSDTAPLARSAGADVFVAGTSIFGAEDAAGAVEKLRAALGD